jgi:hypothetical protein
MTLRLLKRDTTPPSGWKDVLPVGNGFPFMADNLAELVEKEAKFLRLNGHEVPADLKDQIEDRICHRLPKGLCEDPVGRAWTGGYAVAPSVDVTNNTMNLRRSNAFVSQSESNRRAAICMTCSMAQMYRGGCGSCKGLDSAMKSMLPGRQAVTPDLGFRVCDALGVFLRVLVQLNVPALEPTGAVSVDERCWQLKGSGENGTDS